MDITSANHELLRSATLANSPVLCRLFDDLTGVNWHHPTRNHHRTIGGWLHHRDAGLELVPREVDCARTRNGMSDVSPLVRHLMSEWL
jgi:hypothetical protein